jgi:hypothetical protein
VWNSLTLAQEIVVRTGRQALVRPTDASSSGSDATAPRQYLLSDLN